MIKKILATLFLVVPLLFATSKPGHAYDVPKYDGPVNDHAQVLSDELEIELEAYLTKFAQESNGAELAIVTIKNLDGESIEDLAQQFFDDWEIGKKELDNGVLLLISIDDREMRIHTGYGVEASLTDSVVGRIIRNDIAPEFKKYNYEAGVNKGANNIIAAIQNPEQFAEKEKPVTEFFIFFLVIFLITFGSGLMVYIAAFLGRSKSWWLGGLIGVVLGMILASITGAIAFAIFGLILDYILSKNYKTWKLQKKATSWGKTSGGFFPTSSSKSSSSSSFSFGGGSSGGGGASGGW
ncbi:MAG: TPM domain-containing protein [Patescibacteria group bacterium]